MRRLARGRDAGDRARPETWRHGSPGGAVLPPRRRSDRPSPVHRGARARAGGERGPSDACARDAGALLHDARQPAAPGGGARRVAPRPVARRRGPGAAGGALARSRRCRSGAALTVSLELRDRVRGARAQGLTVLAYYSAAAREAFWTEHWGGHSVEELLAVARRSPLTTLITGALPADGVVLEAARRPGQTAPPQPPPRRRGAGGARAPRRVRRSGGAPVCPRWAPPPSHRARVSMAAAPARGGDGIEGEHCSERAGPPRPRR